MNPSILILGFLKSECTCLVLFLHMMTEVTKWNRFFKSSTVIYNGKPKVNKSTISYLPNTWLGNSK